MAIGEREHASTIMIGGGEVNPLRVLGNIKEIAVVNAVWMFLNKDKDAVGGWDAGESEELRVIGIIDVPAIFDKGTGVANHCVHRVAPDPFRPANSSLLFAQ